MNKEKMIEDFNKPTMVGKTKVQAIRVDLLCPGWHEKSQAFNIPMEFTGMVLTSYPEQYPHVCPDCGRRETVFKQYPTIEFEEMPDYIEGLQAQQAWKNLKHEQ